MKLKPIKIKDQVYFLVWNQIYNEVEDQVRSQVSSRVSIKVYSQVRNYIEGQVSSQIEDQLENKVENQVWNQVRTKVIKPNKIINFKGDKMKPFNDSGVQEANMKVGEYSLHGDVIITRVNEIPADFEKGIEEPKSALAYGEATGHIHQLQGEPGRDFDLKILPDNTRFLRVFAPTLLKHQEHSPILLKEGNYKIGIQREYDPFEKLTRSVID